MGGGIVKSLIIGGFIMVLVMVGYVDFVTQSLIRYDIPTASNTSALKSKIIIYGENMSTHSSEFQEKVTGNNTMTIGANTWLGIIFNSFGAMSRTFFNLGGFYTIVLSDLTTGAYPIPDWFIGTMLSIIMALLVIGVIAIMINRRQEDL